MDARSLDVLADNLPALHVLHDHLLHPPWLHPIIQSRRAAWPWEGRKPTAGEPAWWGGEDLPHQDVRALGAAPETTLPGELGRLAHAVGLERRTEHLVQRGGAAPVATLGAAADHHSETTIGHVRRS